MDIGKKYNVVDSEGKQIERKVNGYSVTPKINGSELQNVKKYLESKSRFVLGNRKLARPGAETDFLEIKFLNFYNKKDDNNYELLEGNKQEKTQIKPMSKSSYNKEEIHDFHKEYNHNINEYIEKTDYENERYNDLRDDIIDDIHRIYDIEHIKEKYEEIYTPRKFDNLYFTKDIYQPE